MQNSKIGRGFAGVLIAALLGGCAMTPEQKSYRQRLEMGFTTLEDIERFNIPEPEQQALIADANTLQPRYAQALDTQLMLAAGSGDVARIKALLAQGAQVNAVDGWGNSALLYAAREGEMESARTLLKAGAYVDGRGGAMPPLAATALRGHAILAGLLIRNGADVNAVGENGLSTLMNAVKLGHREVAKALLDAGANTRVLDRDGQNLLGVAVNENDPGMLALLLSYDVNPDLADSNGLTALYWAEYLEQPGMAQLLHNAGADPARKKTEVVASQPYKFGEF